MAEEKRKRNRLAFPLGLILIILAVVGAVTAARSGVDLVKNLTDKSDRKAEYEELLKPVVMYDPDPFDDVSNADLSQLVNAAIWSLITKSDSAEAFSYSSDDNIGILIPSEEVTEEFMRLFGPEVDIASMYSSIDMSSIDITYDSAQNGFIIPITGLDVAYIPHITEVEKQGDSVILTVEYIGGKAWADYDSGEYSSPSADKYMKVTLRKGDNNYYISSIQALSSPEVADVTVSAPVVATIKAEDLTETTEETSIDEGEETSDLEEETEYEAQ